MAHTDLESSELTSLLFGDHIADGVYRSVFIFRPDPNYVIKRERFTHYTCNLEEMRLWHAADRYDMRRWLAPCTYISDRGLYLIQRRTYPAAEQKMPKKIPKWITDTKIQNWGYLNKNQTGPIVCHDYANNFVDEHGMSRVLKKARWWDDS